MKPKFRLYNIVHEEMEYFEDYRDLSYMFSGLDSDNGFYEELMQSTGLKDKNGTEIYEGDIIQHSEKPNPVFKYPFEVVQFKTGEWRLDNFRGGTVLAYCNQDELEVIGNIFQNSELLEADSHE